MVLRTLSPTSLFTGTCELCIALPGWTMIDSGLVGWHRRTGLKGFKMISSLLRRCCHPAANSLAEMWVYSSSRILSIHPKPEDRLQACAMCPFIAIPTFNLFDAQIGLASIILVWQHWAADLRSIYSKLFESISHMKLKKLIR